ncbi:MAG: tRNA (adenosine(37)-N6)-threonylcarbamoyltransferase complex dimerization subunit type 1 TsaB [Rhodospirillales bacterium]|nr:tRNA (adenosine(37)-N6)-threonylcarbamoyltransferase complex dimerization subunit type 1 TsaB [Rhodospirillales bacterium]
MSTDAAGLALAVHGLLAGRAAPAAVAVGVGPGSFTGLRAAASLGQGLAQGWAVPCVGVAAAEALAATVGDIATRALWVAIAARPGHIHLIRGAQSAVVACADIPHPAGAVAIAGDAAPLAAAWLAARGADVMLTAARTASPAAIAAIARERLAGQRPALPPLPLYGEPPRVTAAPRRPAPV